MGSGGEMNGSSKSGTGVYSSDGHGYCLRWNNHKSNLVEILESLIKMECYVDCTIYVDNHVQFKAHRVVLAACSPYFQLILQDAPQDHCSLILPGVQEFEMRTLLEYIYAGEVNIAESLIPRIMKIAKMLEVKGLLDMVDLPSDISQQPITSPPNNNLFRPASNPSVSAEGKRDKSVHLHPLTHSSPIIRTSTKISSAQSSSSPPYKMSYIASFPQTGGASREFLPGAAGQDNPEERNRLWSQMPTSLSRSNQSMLSSVYETGSDMNPLKRKKLSSISSMLMTRDTPILRNVLAQSIAADSSQGASLNANPSPTRVGGNGTDNNESNDTNNNDNSNNVNAGNTSGNNGSVYVGYLRKSSDRSYHSSNGSDHSDKVNKASREVQTASLTHSFHSQKFKDEEPSSPFTDRSFDDEPMTGERRTSPPEFLADLRLPPYLQQHQLQQAQFHHQQHGQGSQSSSAGQKPEWKRYKQYTRNDIMSAIECVRNGMSALQASRKFGVPSRTLYDKVKKLGITTGTPRNRSSMKREGREGAGPSSSSAAFPYGSLSGAAGAFGLYPNQDNQLSQSQDFDPEMEELKHHHRANPHPASILDPVFLQKALEARGEEGAALHAMALAAAAHAQFNGMSQTSPRAHGSQSPSMLTKYISRSLEAEMSRERERSRSNGEHTAVKREPVEESDEEMETSERAENLSLSKRESPSWVTPPPMVRTPPFTATTVTPPLRTTTTPPIEQPRGVIVPPMKYSSPRSEPSSTTPPSIMEQPLALDKSEFKQNLSDPSPIALTPTTTANYDE